MANYCYFHVAIEFSRCSGCGEAIVGIGVEDLDNPSRSLHNNCLEIRILTNSDSRCEATCQTLRL